MISLSKTRDGIGLNLVHADLDLQDYDIQMNSTNKLLGESIRLVYYSVVELMRNFELINLAA